MYKYLIKFLEQQTETFDLIEKLYKFWVLGGFITNYRYIIQNVFFKDGIA